MEDVENMVGCNMSRIFDVLSFLSLPFMLLSACKWVSGASGEMKFGILVGGLENYLSCITAAVGPEDLEVKTLFNVQFFSRWSIDSCWTWRSTPLPPSLPLFRLARHSASVVKLRLLLTLTVLVDSQPKVLFNSQGPWRPPPPPQKNVSHSHHLQSASPPHHPSPSTPPPSFLLLRGPCLGH